MSMDKRSFFRLDVILPCSYKIYSAEDAKKNPLPGNPGSSYIEKNFLQDLAELDGEITDIIAQIGQKSRLMATALTAINSKVNFVLQTIDEKNLSQAIPQRAVNVSAGGLSFEVDQSVKITDVVDVLIQPLADESPILIRCDIVKIFPEKDDKNQNTIAVEFQKIAEDDRRKLVYYIQQKEIEFAQEKRK